MRILVVGGYHTPITEPKPKSAPLAANSRSG
jgi:hypothetical protein